MGVHSTGSLVLITPPLPTVNGTGLWERRRNQHFSWDFSILVLEGSMAQFAVGPGLTALVQRAGGSYRQEGLSLYYLIYQLLLFPFKTQYNIRIITK